MKDDTPEVESHHRVTAPFGEEEHRLRCIHVEGFERFDRFSLPSSQPRRRFSIGILDR